MKKLDDILSEREIAFLETPEGVAGFANVAREHAERKRVEGEMEDAIDARVNEVIRKLGGRVVGDVVLWLRRGSTTEGLEGLVVVAVNQLHPWVLTLVPEVDLDLTSGQILETWPVTLVCGDTRAAFDHIRNETPEFNAALTNVLQEDG